MELCNQIVSFDIAKKLKKLGVKQDSLFYWRYLNDGKHSRWVTECPYFLEGIKEGILYQEYIEKMISAFTVSELGIFLPDLYLSFKTTGNHPITNEKLLDWTIYKEIVGDKPTPFVESTEADVRAKMLIHLIEKGFVNKENCDFIE